MKKFFNIFLLLIFFVTPSMASEQLDEVNLKFTYTGKPIHPFLVREFSNWLSDYREILDPAMRQHVEKITRSLLLE